MAGAIEAVPARNLWEQLGRIPDRRGRKGRRYGRPAVLTLVLAAMLSGADDLKAVFRWGRRLPPEALFRLGLDRAPCRSMCHDFFKALDVTATEAVLGAWLRGTDDPGHVALDGKRLRGSAPDGRDGSEGVDLVPAFASTWGGAIGQLQDAPDANEISAALSLLEGLPLQGAVVTGDAILCRRAVCQDVCDRQGAYLFSVKANQPEPMADLALALGDAFPPPEPIEAPKAVGAVHPSAPERKPAPDPIGRAQTVEKGQGRLETRQRAVSRACCFAALARTAWSLESWCDVISYRK